MKSAIQASRSFRWSVVLSACVSVLCLVASRGRGGGGIRTAAPATTATVDRHYGDDRHLISTARAPISEEALQWRGDGDGTWNQDTAEPLDTVEEQTSNRSRDDNGGKEYSSENERKEKNSNGEISRNDAEASSPVNPDLAVNFKTVLLTYLVPSPRGRSRQGQAGIALDSEELIRLTSNHLLIELTNWSNRKDDIRKVRLVVTPVQSQVSSDSDKASTVAVSEAIEGEIFFSDKKVLMDSNDVQIMVINAFEGDALERYVRRVRIYAEDPYLENLRSVYMGLPWDDSDSENSEGQQNEAELKVIWIAVVAAIVVSVACTVGVYLLRGSLATALRRSEPTPTRNKSRDSAETTHGDDDDDDYLKDEHEVVDLSRVESYQLSELMSVYVEGNTLNENRSSSVKPPIKRVVAHHMQPKQGRSSKSWKSDAVVHCSHQVDSPSGSASSDPEERCVRSRAAAENKPDSEHAAFRLADAAKSSCIGDIEKAAALRSGESLPLRTAEPKDREYDFDIDTAVQFDSDDESVIFAGPEKERYPYRAM